MAAVVLAYKHTRRGGLYRYIVQIPIFDCSYCLTFIGENTFRFKKALFGYVSVGLPWFSAAVALFNIYIYLWFFCLKSAAFFAIIIDIVRI